MYPDSPPPLSCPFGPPGHRLKSLPPTPQSHLLTLALAPLSPITDLATSFSLALGLPHEQSPPSADHTVLLGRMG